MSRAYDPNVNTATSQRDLENTMLQATVRPADRVRWSAIVAGLVTAIAAMVLLSVLGAAIGLSAYDQGESGRAYGVAAGLWAIISAILAFFAGGYVAARTAGIFGRENAILNGTMVWATTIPLSLFFLTGGALSLLGGAAANPDATRPIMASSVPQQDQTLNQNAGTANAMSNVAENLRNNQQGQPQDRAARTAWFTLVSLLLGLGAAALGGHVGARGVRDRDEEYNRGDRGGPFRDREYREYRPATTTTTSSGGMSSGTHPYGGPTTP